MSLWHATDTQRAQVMKMEQGNRVARLHLLILAAVPRGGCALGGQPPALRPKGVPNGSAVVFPEEALCVGPVYG